MARHSCEICDSDIKTTSFLDEGVCTNPKCQAVYEHDKGVFLKLGNVVRVDLERGEVTFKIHSKKAARRV